jgi:hypothetical protein
MRRALNILIRPFGTDITRSFEAMLEGLLLRILADRPVLMRGAYRAILLQKEPAAPRRSDPIPR